MRPTDHDQPNCTCCDTVSASAEESIRKAVAGLSASLDMPRTIIRPDFSPRKGLCKLLLALAVFVGVGLVLRACSLSVLWVLPLMAVTLLCNGKKVVVWLVLAYQRYAPEKLRASCLFTPSCSEYMLLAIEKYGLYKGICKGIRRLLRCHRPNGGVDYP